MSFTGNILKNVSIEKENLPEFKPEPLAIGRFKLFGSLFLGKLNTMIFINIFALIFAIPLILVLFLLFTDNLLINTIIPYGGNLGLGYPVAVDPSLVGKEMLFESSVRFFLLLMPCILVLFIGFAGAFNVMRRQAWSEGEGVVKPFFIGLKKYFLPFLIVSVAVAGSATLLLINIAAFEFLSIPLWLNIILLILDILLFILVLCVAMFFTTQAVTFKLKFSTLLKNSFLFALGLFPQNLIMLIFCAAPFVLVFFTINVQFLGTLLLMFLVMIGLSYFALLWTVYGQWVYESYFITPVEKKRPAVYGVKEEKAKVDADAAIPLKEPAAAQNVKETAQNSQKRKEPAEKTEQQKASKSKASFTRYKKK